MTAMDTLPKLMRRNAETMAARPAMRERRRGIWQTVSWSEYDNQVRAFASGLAAQGFRRGHRLAVVGDNRPKLYWALLAAQALGGVGVAVWPDADPEWAGQRVARRQCVGGARGRSRPGRKADGRAARFAGT